MTLLYAERFMLLNISRQPAAVWMIPYMTEHYQHTFNHLHDELLLEPSADHLSYHLSERGRAALASGTNGAALDHRHALDYLRDAGETW